MRSKRKYQNTQERGTLFQASFEYESEQLSIEYSHIRAQACIARVDVKVHQPGARSPWLNAIWLSLVTSCLRLSALLPRLQASGFICWKRTFGLFGPSTRAEAMPWWTQV